MAFAQPQDNLVPVGGGFYATPNEPQPANFDNPLSRRILGLEYQIIADPCNFGLQVNADFLFMRLPSFQVLYRAEGCTPPPPLPKPTVPIDLSADAVGNITGNEQAIFCVLVQSKEQRSSGARLETVDNTQGLGTVLRVYTEYKTKIQIDVTSYSYPVTFSDGSIGSRISAKETGTTTKHYSDAFENEDLAGTTSVVVKEFSYSWNVLKNGNDDHVTWLKEEEGSDRFLIRQGDITLYVCQGQPGFIIGNTLSQLYNFYQNTFAFQEIYEQLTVADIPSTTGNYGRRWDRLYIIDSTPRYDPPPPPKPPKEDDMPCCPGQQNNDRLIRLVLSKIGKFPVKELESHLTEKGVQPTKEVSINSISEYMQWNTQILDQVLGEWESTFNVKDANGKQQKVHLPNIAEAISEMYSFMLQTYVRTDDTRNIVTRCLLELGSIKQTDFTTHEMLNSLIEFINFEHKEVKKKMPLSFDPHFRSDRDDNYTHLLQLKEVDVSCIEYNGKQTFFQSLHQLLIAASVIQGVYLRKVPKEKVTTTMIDDLTRLAKVVKGESLEDIQNFLDNYNKSKHQVENANQ